MLAMPAPTRHRQLFLLGFLDFGGSRAEDVECDEEGEREGGGVRGVDERGERRGEDGWGGEGGPAVGAVDEQEGEDGGDVGVHG